VLVATLTSSPLNIISTWAMEPLNVVESSPSSVPKAMMNCLSHSSFFLAAASPARLSSAAVAVSSDS